MSYILDALQKAEKTRQQTTETTPVSHHISVSETPVPWHKKPLFITPFIIVSLILLWLFLLPQQQRSIPSAIKNAPVVQAKPQPKTQKQQVQKPFPKANKGTTSAAKEMAMSIEEKPIPTLLGLPEHLRGSLPVIQISGHMYATKAKKRMVIINNKLMREGSYISGNLRLTTITPNGVELSFDGVRFSMSSSEAWPN